MMKRFSTLSLLAISSLLTTAPGYAQTSPAAADAPLKLSQTIALPSAMSGKFDHIAVDTRRNRAILTAESQKSLIVVDLATGKTVTTVHGVGKPHGIFYRADSDRLFVTDGSDGVVLVLDAATYHIEHRVALSVDADSVGYDPSTQMLYVDNGGKDAGLPYSLVSVVDTNSAKKVADIHVDGDRLEAMALDMYRPRLYVNDTAKNAVVVIDRWTRKPIASWPVTLGKVNVAMALDEAHERLFVACRDGHIVVFNSTTGKELTSFPTISEIDDLAYDPLRGRLYAAGDGAVAVYQQHDADHYESVGQVETGRHAITGRLVSAQGQYLTVVPASPSLLVLHLTDEAQKPYPTAPFAYDPQAPYAERLVMTTLSEHPFLRKLGLHAIKPGQHVSVLLANGNATRRGIETTPGDFAAVASAKQYAPLIPNGSFYNVKLPLFDAAGRRIGLIVMEIPSSAARNYDDAIAKADAIRAEISRQIPSLASLFVHPA